MRDKLVMILREYSFATRMRAGSLLMAKSNGVLVDVDVCEIAVDGTPFTPAPTRVSERDLTASTDILEEFGGIVQVHGED